MRSLVTQLSLRLLFSMIAVAAVACGGPSTPESARPAPTGAQSAVATDLRQLEREDGQWIMPAKNYASTRFSGLTEITTENVKNLRLA